MKKNILFMFVVTLISNFAFADVIKCTFTEPFVDTTYDTGKQTLVIYDMGKKIKTVRNVSFLIKGPAEFELVKNGKVLQKLSLNMKGSNGMSDHVYPYEALDTSMDYYPEKGLLGGCSSSLLKEKDGEGSY